MPLFVGACISLATLPIWWLINARLLGKLLLWPFAAAALGGALSSPPGPNARYLGSCKSFIYLQAPFFYIRRVFWRFAHTDSCLFHDPLCNWKWFWLTWLVYLWWIMNFLNLHGWCHITPLKIHVLNLRLKKFCHGRVLSRCSFFLCQFRTQNHHRSNFKNWEKGRFAVLVKPRLWATYSVWDLAFSWHWISGKRWPYLGITTCSQYWMRG